jgi:hypothetical protein
MGVPDIEDVTKVAATSSEHDFAHLHVHLEYSLLDRAIVGAGARSQ